MAIGPMEDQVLGHWRTGHRLLCCNTIHRQGHGQGCGLGKDKGYDLNRTVVLTSVINNCSLSSLAIKVDDPIYIGRNISGGGTLVKAVDVEV